MDVAYQTQSRLITKIVDKLPFIAAKDESRINIDGEFAHFVPGHAKVIGSTGTSYIDDFEAAKSTIDLKIWPIGNSPVHLKTDNSRYVSRSGALHWTGIRF